MTESTQRPGLAEVPRPEASEATEQTAAASPESGASEGSDESSESAGVESAAQEEELSGAAAPSSPQQASSQPARRGGWLVSLVLVIALVICAVLLFQQVRRAEVLEGRVSSLSSELAGARSRLALYEGRMTAVREGVADLFGQVAGLRDLVNDPLPGESGKSAAVQPPQPEPPAEEPRGALPGTEGRPGARL